jgi:hypothetical protein
MVANFIIRFIKRFAVLVPGVIIAYFSVRDIFPELNNRLPAGLAVFVTYVLAAYVLIPALTRLFRIFLPARHLPLYSTTPDGYASDPVNIGIIGTREELGEAMRAAGWHQADPHTWRNVAREVVSTLLRQPYPTAPMSTLYLLGRKQDISFQLPLEGQAGFRHHVRFWATTYDSSQPLSAKTIHWLPRKYDQPTGKVLWMGAASFDVGFAPIRHNLQITHMIHPNTDNERELIATQLHETGYLKDKQTVKIATKPYRLANRALRGYLETDGNMTVCTLKRRS